MCLLMRLQIGMVSSHLLRFLHLAKLNNKNIRVILVGDSWQLPPVKVAHTETECVKVLCDYNRVPLTVNKRFDERLRRIAEKYYLTGDIDLKAFGDSEKLIDTYATPTAPERQSMTDWWRSTKVKKCLELKYNEKYENKPTDHDPKKLKEWQPVSQYLVLNVCMPIICRENCKELELVNNEEYKVVGLTNAKKLLRLTTRTSQTTTTTTFNATSYQPMLSLSTNHKGKPTTRLTVSLKWARLDGVLKVGHCCM